MKRSSMGAVALVLGSVVTAAACSSPSGTGGGSNVVLLKHFNAFEKAYNESLASGFEKENPGTKVTVETPQTGAVFTKFQALLAGGQAPDVYLANLNYLPALQSKHLLAPLDPSAFGVASVEDLKAQYINSALQPWVKDGKLYGVPEEVSNYQAWVNKSYFDQAGLQVPKTWADVCAAGSKVTKVNNGQVQQEVIALPTNFPDGLGLILDAVAREFGTTLFNESGTAINLTSPGVTAEFQMFQDLVYKCHAFHPELNGSTTAQERTLYGEGKAAILLDAGSWYAPLLQQQYPAVWKQSTVSPYPTQPGVQPANDIYGYAYVVPAAAPDKTLAWKYANFLKGQGPSAFKLGLYSGLKSLDSTPTAANTPFWKDKWVPSLTQGKPQPLLLNASHVYDELSQAFDAIVLNHADVKTTLAQAQANIEPLLNK